MPTPYNGSPAAIPGVIEAEHYDNGVVEAAYHDTTPGSHGQNYNVAGHPPPSFRSPTDVDIYESPGYSGSYLIVMQAGDWMGYTVNVESSGTYTLQAQIAWGGVVGGTFHVEFDGVDKTGPIQIPDTAWTLQTITRTGVQLHAGQQRMRIVADTDAANSYTGDIDFIRFTSPEQTPFNGSPATVPGTVEAEHYDNGGAGVAYHDTSPGSHGQNYSVADYPPPAFRSPTDVDIYESVGYSGNYLVLSQAGDWTEYTVNVATSGTYTLRAQVAWGGTGGVPGTFHVEFDGVDKTGPLQIPDTNWAFTEITKSGVQISAGRHVMQVVADSNAANGYMGDIDYIMFVAEPARGPHSLALNGTDAWVQAPNSASLNITGPVTVEAWIKANAAGGVHGIVERYGLSGGQGGYALRLMGGKLRFYTLADGYNYDFVESSSAVSTGVWHHVAGVFDGGQLRVYIDGALNAWKASGHAPGGGNTGLMIGQTGATHSPFNGLIDEVRVTAGARYQSNFTPLTAQGADGDDTRGLWNFNGQTAHDSSGKGNHGSLAGGAGFSADVLANTKPASRLEAAGGMRSVKIGFDDLPHGRFVSNQYTPAVFSSAPGVAPYAYDPRTNPPDTTHGESFPNVLNRAGNTFPFTMAAFAPLTVDFTVPVSNLRFIICSIDANWGTIIFQLDIYQRGAHVATWNIQSFGRGHNVLVNVGKPLNPSGIDEVTKIVIRNIPNYEGGGLTFDDFSFEYPEDLKVDITNPRVGGSLNGTSQKAMVGADIPLQAVSNLGGGSYSWSFTGPFSVSGGGTNSSSVTIRPTGPGAITAKVTYAQGGSIVSGTVNISAIMPQLVQFEAEQSVSVLITTPLAGWPCGASRPGKVLWQLGCPPSYESGISFEAITMIPAGQYLTDLSQSGVKYVQAVSAMRKIRLSNGTVACVTGRTGSEDNVNSGWTLDDLPEAGLGDPMSFSPSSLRRFSENNILVSTAEDSPATIWTRDVDDAIKHDDRFQTYIVYFVGSNPKIPQYQQRIGSLQWEWRGQVAYNAIGFQPSDTGVPYVYQQNLNTETKSIEWDEVVSTTVYHGLHSSNKVFRQCPGGPPPVQNQIDGSRFFANQHFFDFLNRAPDQPGSDFWTSNITPCAFDDGCITRKRVDVARAFFYSSEFISQIPGLADSQRGTDSYNREFVRQCYYRYLLRTCDPEVCDPGGFNFWVTKLNNQWPTMGDGAYNEMLKAFIVSTAYRQRFGPP